MTKSQRIPDDKKAENGERGTGSKALVDPATSWCQVRTPPVRWVVAGGGVQPTTAHEDSRNSLRSPKGWHSAACQHCPTAVPVRPGGQEHRRGPFHGDRALSPRPTAQPRAGRGYRARRSDGQQPITDHTQGAARKVRQGSVRCPGQHSRQEPIEELLVEVLGVQHCRAQHNNEEELEADQDDADRPAGQKRKGAGNEASPPTAAQPHTVPKGPFGSPAGCSGGPGHQPPAGSPAAGGWARGNEGTLTASRRRVLVSSPAPPSPVGEHGAGTVVRPCCTAGARAGQREPAAQQHSPGAAGSPVPGETLVGGVGVRWALPLTSCASTSSGSTAPGTGAASSSI